VIYFLDMVVMYLMVIRVTARRQRTLQNLEMSGDLVEDYISDSIVVDVGICQVASTRSIGDNTIFRLFSKLWIVISLKLSTSTVHIGMEVVSKFRL